MPGGELSGLENVQDQDGAKKRDSDSGRGINCHLLIRQIWIESFVLGAGSHSGLQMTRSGSGFRVPGSRFQFPGKLAGQGRRGRGNCCKGMSCS